MSIKYTHWLRSYVGHQRIFQVRASGFLCDDQGRVLLGRRADVMLWDVPGGTIEPDETPVQGLIREVETETGLTITPGRLIGVYAGPDFTWTYPNGDQAQIVCIFMHCSLDYGELHLANRENVTLDFFAPDHLPPLLPRTRRMLADAFANRVEARSD